MCSLPNDVEAYLKASRPTTSGRPQKQLQNTLKQLWELPGQVTAHIGGHLSGLAQRFPPRPAGGAVAFPTQPTRLFGAAPSATATSRSSSSKAAETGTAAPLMSLSAPAAAAPAEAGPTSSHPAAVVVPPRGSAAGTAPHRTSKEELGRATWTLLHTLAAQLPDKPTRQQQRDVRNLVDILTRIYPCGDCAEHWSHIVKGNPPQVQTRAAFQQWLCRAHNVVNRSLGKPTFNCDLADLAWGPLDCGGGAGAEDAAAGCSIRGGGGGGGGRR